jgi:hypothetical protein
MTEHYEDQKMAGAVFHRVDLGEATFDDVNLYRARFDNVNLGDATIRNANLSNLVIEDAAINGLTIFGIRVDQLIEAELDRRDPERVRLRIDDPFDSAQVRRVMAHLDEVRADFYALLRATPQAHLTHHSGPNAWSALEHARHLLFAEDMYLNRWLLRNDRPWCRMGHLPPFLAEAPFCAEVGTEPTEDLVAVLAAWDEIHAGTQAYVRELTRERLHQDTSDVDFGQGTVGGVLKGMAQHDLAHIRMAEAALQRAEAAAGEG